MSIVTIWSVFLNPVTYACEVYISMYYHGTFLTVIVTPTKISDVVHLYTSEILLLLAT